MRHQMIRAIWSSDDGHLIRHEKLRILLDHLDASRDLDLRRGWCLRD